MKDWFLSLHPALLVLVAILGFTLGFFAKRQCKRFPNSAFLSNLWGLVAGLGFGVGLGLSFRLLFVLAW